MNKLLTISIAAYNVADYIEETLDSLVSSKYINNHDDAFYLAFLQNGFVIDLIRS